MFWKRTHGAVKLQQDSLKHRGGRPRANALRPYVRQACRCAELGSLFRHISMSLPVEGRAGQPRPQGWETASRERRGFFNSSATECGIVQ
jgi:hypothetical protein